MAIIDSMHDLFYYTDLQHFVGYSDIFYRYAWLWSLIALWSLAWKGAALWRAAKMNSMPWFIGILIFNTFGMLEIVYILITQKQYQEQKEYEIQRSQT